MCCSAVPCKTRAKRYKPSALSVRRSSRIFALLQLRDNVFPKQLNGGHDFFVRNRLSGHEELQLVDTDGGMDVDGFETALGIARDGDPPVGQRVGIELIPDGLGDLRRAAREIHPSVIAVSVFFFDVTREVGL